MEPVQFDPFVATIDCGFWSDFVEKKTKEWKLSVTKIPIKGKSLIISTRLLSAREVNQ
jgi:hypothetical protein